jgi:asparagine synthase (glutamine-hydrolysing)
MCGFTGFSSFKRDLYYDGAILECMNLKIKKRGPDEDGAFIDKHICMAHRRLIIVDAENGKQPMEARYGDATYEIVYNGQIYNKEKIRKELKNVGFDFVGYSDTEVLLKAFIYFGTDVLKRLNGIFSFAIWNSKEECLYLVRDHFGIKPLYYTILNDTIVFASEVKAILEYPGVEAIIDKTGVAELFGLRTCTYTWNYSL